MVYTALQLIERALPGMIVAGVTALIALNWGVRDTVKKNAARLSHIESQVTPERVSQGIVDTARLKDMISQVHKHEERLDALDSQIGRGILPAAVDEVKGLKARVRELERQR